MSTAFPSSPSPWPGRWQRLSAASLRGFHAYAGWLVGVSWTRLLLLSVLLLIVACILSELPPFRWTYTTHTRAPRQTAASQSAVPPARAPEPSSEDTLRKLERLRKLGEGLDIRIDDKGVRITTRPAAVAAPTGTVAGASTGTGAATPTSTASAASAASGAASAGGHAVVDINVALPPAANSAEVKEAVEEARQAIEEAVRDASDAANDATQAQRDAASAAAATGKGHKAVLHIDADGDTVHEVRMGDFLPTLAMLWIVASAIVKITYKRQIQAEAQAAQAVQTAEAESLKRQVVEARMAAMQAQVEPHFLFNTLASIDHLIETDPPRASLMQKHLIALLRASMPSMRQAGSGAGHAGGWARDLGGELAVIRPYLEILKVRMEERLATTIDVPEGLESAEFPPMMLQTLVENAIKHGLEPKPEGGTLSLKAEVRHGKLALSVADTGLGFGKAATAGTGVGLANIRERLALLYGRQAALAITENPGGGTRATITVPYRPVPAAASAATGAAGGPAAEPAAA